MMNKKTKIVGLIVFIAFYLLTRLPRLGTTIVNTDEVYWHNRSENFLNALENKDYVKTFQKYHPGIPLMWETDIIAKILSSLDNITISEVFNNFEYLHSNIQFFLVVWFFILSVLFIFLLHKVLDNWWLAFLSVVVLTLEPFYVGNSRLIHHDVQISLCVIIAMTLVYLFSAKKFSILYIIFASFFLAVGALSKTLFVGAFIFNLFAGSLITFFRQGGKKTILFVFTIVLGFMFFYVALFPAIWVKPFETLRNIFLQSYNVGEESGHKQIFFGEETRDPGPLFYPVLLWLKTSPFMIIGIIIFFVGVFYDFLKKLGKKERYYLKDVSFIFFSGVFYLGYFAVITYFSKKVDRYFVPLYPYLSIISVYGWYRFVKKKILIIIPIAIFLVTVALPLYSIFPHYLMYVNPIIGDAKKANDIIGQKLFGIGVFDLRKKIIDKYGESAAIGTNDFGPLMSIYPKGKVYNVLVEHPNSFEIMVLGPNKDFPISMKKDSNIKFEYVDSVFINGLEFWRIYKKVY